MIDINKSRELKSKYKEDIDLHGNFMQSVLKEAIKRLDTCLEDPNHVEDFVNECERAWSKNRKNDRERT